MAYLHGEPLFRGDFIRDFLGNHFARFREIVNSVPKEQFTRIDDETVVEHVLSKLHIEPLVIYPDQMTRSDVREFELTRQDYGMSAKVPANQIDISVPYSGDPMLWALRYNLFQSIYPQGRTTSTSGNGFGIIEISIIQDASESPEKVKELLNKTIADICMGAASQKSTIEAMTMELRPRILDAINQRRNKLRAGQALEEAINIPLVRREGAPDIRPIAVERKYPRPLPSVPGTHRNPVPGISIEHFEDILALIRHVGRTFETTPKTYSVHDEEELRDILLAHLNGIYQGGATGETFRRKGKTDIRIEDAERAAFVAECKIWKGEAELSKGIGQLLSYLTWRDCKASFIIFNKNNAKFTELQAKVPGTFRDHELQIREVEQQPTGEWRYQFSVEGDRDQQITVHVFLFNLFAGEPRPK